MKALWKSGGIALICVGALSSCSMSFKWAHEGRGQEEVTHQELEPGTSYALDFAAETTAVQDPANIPDIYIGHLEMVDDHTARYYHRSQTDCLPDFTEMTVSMVEDDPQVALLESYDADPYMEECVSSGVGLYETVFTIHNANIFGGMVEGTEFILSMDYGAEADALVVPVLLLPSLLHD